MLPRAAWLRELGLAVGHGWCMLGVVDEARVAAGDGHAAWSESFNELFMHAAGVFSNARVRRHGRAYLLGLLSQSERRNSWQRGQRFAPPRTYAPPAFGKDQTGRDL